MGRIGRHIACLVIAEMVLFLPYLFLLIGLAFNDAGYETDSLASFFKVIVPIYIYLFAIFLISLALSKWVHLDRWVVWGFFLPLHLLIGLYAVTLYMGVYLTESANERFNPLAGSMSTEESAPDPVEEQDYTHLYDVTYKDGVVTRSGEAGNSVTWTFTENGERVLNRWAANETTLDLRPLDLFQKGHTYTLHLTSFDVEGVSDYVPVSNQVTFTYQ